MKEQLSRNRVEFQLTDVYGESHEYVTVKLSGSKGLSIFLRLLKVAVPAVGGSVASLTSLNIGSLVGELKGGIAGIVGAKEGESKLADLNIDPVKLTQALSMCVDGIINLGGEKMVREILCETYRDKQEVGKVHAFDAAYQGNFVEMMSALGKVLTINFAPFLSTEHGDG